MMDQIVDEDDKKSEDNTKIMPKKKGRPGRKKGKYCLPTKLYIH